MLDIGFVVVEDRKFVELMASADELLEASG